MEAYLRQLSEFVEVFDKSNIEIVLAMHRLGPRNILEVARQTGIPCATVYARVRKLEKQFMPLTYLNPAYSKLGLVRIAVVALASPGRELIADELLRLPNLWSTTFSTEGPFSHYSTHAVPQGYVSEFRNYLKTLQESGVLQRCHATEISDSHRAFPSFDSFDPKKRIWTLNWDRWLKDSLEPKKTLTISDPSGYDALADKMDLLILKELQKDGRKRFSEISRILGMTLQAVKHRFDSNIVRKGMIQDYVFKFIPYPLEVSDLRELRLEFADERSMNRFFSAATNLPFVHNISKVLGEASLMMTTVVPRASQREFFVFISNLAKSGLINNYSTIRLHPEDQRKQTVSYELYDNELGWQWNPDRCLSVAENIIKEDCHRIRNRHSRHALKISQK
jgi:DNA-binding Lrp family transcriptional regulator